MAICGRRSSWVPSLAIERSSPGRLGRADWIKAERGKYPYNSRNLLNPNQGVHCARGRPCRVQSNHDVRCWQERRRWRFLSTPPSVWLYVFWCRLHIYASVSLHDRWRSSGSFKLVHLPNEAGGLRHGAATW